MTEIKSKYINNQKDMFHRLIAWLHTRFYDRRGCLFLNKRVLDVGCGAGYIGERFKDIVNEYIGIDIVEQELYGNKVIISDACVSLGVCGKYDVICLCHILEEVDNQEQLLENVNNSIARGGQYLIIIPNGIIWKLLRLIKWILPTHVKRHCSYNEVGLVNLLNKFKIKIVEKHPVLAGLYDCYLCVRCGE
jgi:2-polyprenyl-3-methyl-5-hydroxy-6-metoxy-1,4-benzoquinol methylase